MTRRTYLRRPAKVWGDAASAAPPSFESYRHSMDAGEDPLTVESIHNHIYFYSEVNADRCLALLRDLRSMAAQHLMEHQTNELDIIEYPIKPIWLHVQSGGGDLLAALAVADQLAVSRVPVYAVVEGYAASAATLIFMACQRRFIMPNAHVMIHQLRGYNWGTYDQMSDEMDFNAQLMARLVSFYVDHTTMSNTEVGDLLKRDKWFGAEESVRLGLVDEIYGVK